MKDSCVAWIGEIPQGWDVYTLKSVASVNDNVLNEDVAVNSVIEYVDIGSVSADKGIEFTQAMEFGDAPSRARRLVKHGDIIISTVRTYLCAIAPIVKPPSNLVVSTGFAVIRPRKKIVYEFVAYSLQDDIFMSEVTARSIGVSYPAINANELMSIQIVVPPHSEQLAIAAYLDRQTALIDQRLATLAEKKAVLAELRKATIHDAVTKGLSKAASMKDSGVAWIGEIPAHWTICRVKDKCRLIGGSTPSPQEIGDEFSLAWATPTDFDDITRTLEHTSRKISAAGHKEIGKTLVREGAVLISCRAPAGKVAYVTSSLSFNQGCKGLIPNQGINGVYAFYVMVSMRGAIESEARGTTFQEISGVNLGRIHITVPPLPEQLAIADYLDQQTQQFDAQLATLDEQARVLKELRKAIIHEAVTGKIDLSGYTPQTPEALAA